MLCNERTGLEGELPAPPQLHKIARTTVIVGIVTNRVFMFLQLCRQTKTTTYRHLEFQTLGIAITLERRLCSGNPLLISVLAKRSCCRRSCADGVNQFKRTSTAANAESQLKLTRRVREAALASGHREDASTVRAERDLEGQETTPTFAMAEQIESLRYQRVRNPNDKNESIAC